MPLNNGFQTAVNNELPNGVPGDFAGINPRTTVDAPPGGFVAAPAGITAGCFAWGNPTSGDAGNYYQPNSFLGFVRRGMQALITQFLGIATSLIPSGNPVGGLFNSGDFYALFAAGGTAGQKVYADPLLGTCSAAATGGSVGASIAASSIASTGVLTSGTVTGSALAAGQVLTGAGVPEGTYILSGSGTTWQLANVVPIASGSWPVVASETMNTWGKQETPFFLMESVDPGASFTAALAAPVAPSVGGVLTVSAVASGTILVGDYITATGGGGLPASAGVQIVQQLTGTTGSTGTYLTTATNQVVTSTATFAAAGGQVGKISSWP